MSLRPGWATDDFQTRMLDLSVSHPIPPYPSKPPNVLLMYLEVGSGRVRFHCFLTVDIFLVTSLLMEETLKLLFLHLLKLRNPAQALCGLGSHSPTNQIPSPSGLSL